MKTKNVTNPIDSLALATIAAMGITDSTQKAAISVAIAQARGLGLLSKKIAFYGFIGGTGTTNKYNIFDTSKYTLTFNGGWTHSATGSLPNGTTGYAQTGFIPSVELTSGSQFCGYFGANNITSGGGIDMGVASSGPGINMWLSAGFSSTSFDPFANNGTGTSIDGYLRGNSEGFISTNKIGTSCNLYGNGGVQLGPTVTDAGGYATREFYLGAFNNVGSAAFFSNRELRTVVLSDGLTTTELGWLEQIVYEFNYSLGRANQTYNWIFGDSFTYGVYGTRTISNNWVALLETALGQVCINNGKSGQAITQNRVIGNSLDKTTIPIKSKRDNKLVFAYSAYNEYLTALTVSPFTNTIANMQADFTTLLQYCVNNLGWSYSDITVVAGYYVVATDPDYTAINLWMDGLRDTAISLGCHTIDNRAYEAANGGDTLVIQAFNPYNEHPNAAAQPVLSTNIAANF